MATKQQKNQMRLPFRQRVGVKPRRLLVEGLKSSGRGMALKARRHLSV